MDRICTKTNTVYFDSLLTDPFPCWYHDKDSGHKKLLSYRDLEIYLKNDYVCKASRNFIIQKIIELKESEFNHDL